MSEDKEDRNLGRAREHLQARPVFIYPQKEIVVLVKYMSKIHVGRTGFIRPGDVKKRKKRGGKRKGEKKRKAGP